MRLIDGAEEEDSSDSRSDMLEMPGPHRGEKHGKDARRDKDGDGKKGSEGKDGVHHTEEYWKSSSGKTKADWVKEEEGLNRGHRGSESFAVLNELVVVSPLYLLSLYPFQDFPIPYPEPHIPTPLSRYILVPSPSTPPPWLLLCSAFCVSS